MVICIHYKDRLEPEYKQVDSLVVAQNTGVKGESRGFRLILVANPNYTDTTPMDDIEWLSVE